MHRLLRARLAPHIGHPHHPRLTAAQRFRSLRRGGGGRLLDDAARRSSTAARAPSSPASGFASPDAALLLAFFASGNRSLLAAQAFVEVMLDAHTRGINVDALEAGIRARCLQSSVAQAKAEAEAEAEAEAADDGGATREQQRRPRPGPPLLSPLDQDILLSWMLVTALAASELGIPFGGGGGARAGAGGEASAAAGDGPSSQAVSVRFSREALGLLQYVKTTLRAYFEEEYTLSRVTALQALTSEQQRKGGPAPAPSADGGGSGGGSSSANQQQQDEETTGGGGRSQFAELMQQYTRLVLIAADVASGMRLPTSRPLSPQGALLGRVPTGFAAAFSFVGGEKEEGEEEEQKGEATAQEGGGENNTTTTRALAVRLVVAFMGAALGEGAFSSNAFAACALDAYGRGIAAEELFSALAPQEFAQAGGLVRATGAAAAAASAAGGSASAAGALAAQEINGRLFARWLSLAYFTAAQMGVPFPGAGKRSAGWAWVSGDPVAAQAAKAARAAGRAAQQAAAMEGEPGALPLASFDGDAGERDDEAVEAAGLAAFVSQALALAAAREEEDERRGRGTGGAGEGDGDDPDSAPGGGSGRPEPGTLAAALLRTRRGGERGAGGGDDDGGEGGLEDEAPYEDNPEYDPQALLERQRADVARELRERGTVRGRALPAMVRMPDPGMAANSAAVAAFRQQLGVVGAVRAVAMAAMAEGGGGGGAGGRE